jgi:aminotransferase EvaB
LNRVPLNDLSRSDKTESAHELDLVKKVLESGTYLKSEFTKQFEMKLAERISGKHVLGVANGTDALILAYLGLGLKPGDCILTTPNAGGYASAAAISLGLNVGLIDIEPLTSQMSVEALKMFLDQDPTVKAVVVTHLYGQIGSIQEIVEMCGKYDIPVIEDCAQSFGARKFGKEAGSFGGVATFSFYPTKNLGAAGDAGAVAFSEEPDFNTAAVLAQYGWTDRYKITVPGGFNSRIDEIQAAILVSREKLVDENNIRRREIVAEYSKFLQSPRFIFGAQDESFVAHLAIMHTQNRELDKQKLNSLGIETGIHFPILDHQQPAWSGKFKYFDLSNSEALVNSILTLPCFPTLTLGEIDQVCNGLKNLEVY